MTDKPKVVYMQMDDERKEHWKRVCNEIIDVLRREFDTPIESAAVLEFILESFKDVYGIEETFTMKNGIQ